MMVIMVILVVITMSITFSNYVQTKNHSQSLWKSENISVSRLKKPLQKIRVPAHQVRKSIQPPILRHYVVVFDIDETLCHGDYINDHHKIKELLSIIQEKLPECPLIELEEVYHVFLPHLQILFDYLLEQNVRIAFFSGGSKERNLAVIPKLLTTFWGDQKYEKLKSKGQFDTFSVEDIQKTPPWESDVKDLNVVIRDGESLSDVILVEDDKFYTVHDQQPFIRVRGIFNSFSEYVEKHDYRDVFSINSIYYMIGLFKTYFEGEEYKKLSLREGFQRILPADYKYEFMGNFEESPFVHSMIDVGLAEVQKQVANAKLYD